MADGSIIVDGKIKFREGKKWKPRWCILKKLSPVADRLQVVLYKDVTESRKAEVKPKSVFALDGFFGLHAGFTYDRESYVMAILCPKSISLMAFECRDDMIQFEINIRQSLGEEHQFPVKVVKAPSSCRLPQDQVLLMIHDSRLCLVVLSPPKILMIWNVDDLRRFGVQHGKFCFEGGERCGKGSGVFAFQSEQAEDIADIVHLVSTGKMSNCHRKFKNRSSQIDLGSHLIADLSSSSSTSIHHPNISNSSALRVSAQGALPVNLNCCYDNQSNSAESEDWSWYKRHSVSVMDHRRIAALRENQRMDGVEQFSMGIYDVPPNNRLVIDQGNASGEPLYDSPRSDPISATVSSPHSNMPRIISVSKSGLEGYGDYKKIVPRNKTCGGIHSVEQNDKNRRKRQSANAEVLNVKMSNVAELNLKPEYMDESSREASLQRLKKQESDLQREMILLDEMLQNCATKSQDLASQSFDCSTMSAKTYPYQQKSKVKDPEPLDHSVLSALDSDFTIISGNVVPGKPQKDKSSTPQRLERRSALHLNSSLPEKTPISPLFHAKLNNIPLASRLNKPLPYVNLSKYDDESYSHVHLPGSADCVPSSVHNLNNAQSLLGLKAYSSSLSSLQMPAMASSLKSLNLSSPASHFSALHLPSRSASLHNPRQNQHQHSKMNTVQELQEVLVVDLNKDSCPSEETVYATVQPSFITEKQNSPGERTSGIINILISDAQSVQQAAGLTGEGIYENIPALRRMSPPPPQLPPKGPALLKKLGACAKTSDNNLMSNSHVSKVNACQYDNPKSLVQEECLDGKVDAKEGNYLMMGSPKLRSKHSVDSGCNSKTFSNNANGPKKVEKRHILRKDDYMDMATFSTDSCHEDEIYLDGTVNDTVQQRELYISEADLRLPFPNDVCKPIIENTYMDMSTVTLRKSSFVQSSETSASYVSKTSIDITEDVMNVSQERLQPPTLPPPNQPQLPPRPQQILLVNSTLQEINATPVRGSARVYVKAKNTPPSNQSRSGQGPPTPFPNLLEFSKKMSDSKSTYINTSLDADNNLVPQETYVSRGIPLPEAVKEGFLARFKRRSSKEKSSSVSSEKPAGSKQRNSVLERSMSEHDSSKTLKEEKTSKLKVGRRRSSSFPNRLSYQESVDGTFESGVSDTANVSNKRAGSLSASKGEFFASDQGESSSSVHDFSDESDVSPLIRRSQKAKPDPGYATIMLVSSSSTSVNPFKQNAPQCVKPLKEESSKTDDEKLIEIMQNESCAKKPVVYQRSSSLELKKLNKSADHVHYLKVPKPSSGKERRRSFEKLFGLGFRNSSAPVVHKLSAQDISLPLSVVSTTFRSNRNNSSPLPLTDVHLAMPESSYKMQPEDLPPSLPPKTKVYQSLLTPVSETGPSGSPFSTEPIYVEMDEVVSHLQKDRNAHENHCSEQKSFSNSETEHPISNHGYHGEKKSETKAGRASQDVNAESTISQTCEPDHPLVTIPVDIPFVDISEIEFNFVSDPNVSLQQSCDRLVTEVPKVDNIIQCISPAKTVLRPRSGAEYAVIQRLPTTNANLGYSAMPQSSPHEARIFNFDLQPSRSPKSFSHSMSHPRASPSCPIAPLKPPETVHASSSHSLCSVEATPQRSPGISMTSKSLVSLPEESPVQAKSRRTLKPVSPSEHKTGMEEDLFFFPIDEPHDIAQPPSPYHRSSRMSSISDVNTPIYVNQEFIDKHHNNNQPRSGCSSNSQGHPSPIRAGMQSLMSLFFKDSFSSRHNLQSEAQSVLYRRSSARSGLSESEAIKIEKKPFKINHSRSLTLPHSRGTNPCLSLPGGLHSSQKEVGCKDLLDKERSALDAKSASQNISRFNTREYDNFADSSIISRRRLLQARSEVGVLGSAHHKSGFGKFPSEQNRPQACIAKSSGYKNIDCFGAALAISPSSMPSDLAHAHYSPQPYTALESHKQMCFDCDGHQVCQDLSSCKLSSAQKHPTVLLPSSSPPPLPPRRQRLSSPPSPALSFERTPSEISSDSPPSYYAPSPPSSPMVSDLPPLPPRRVLPGSRFVNTPSPLTPLEPHPASPNSSEDLSQQELNYILVDMTDSAKVPEPPAPPVVARRRSKRARQQKGENSAKSSYALIDFTVTKALQKAGQEHRDDSLRRASGQLNRMNSVPSSSGRKPLTLVSRERKLSSGSIESC